MRRLGQLLGAAFLFPRRVLRSWRWRTSVSGHSMDPTLRDGDFLFVDPDLQRLEIGHIVVVSDPRSVGRLIVKRVVEKGTDSELTLGSDHPAHADERIAVATADVVGRAWLRYWPPQRLGRI
jgi:hypothetical protein